MLKFLIWLCLLRQWFSLRHKFLPSHDQSEENSLERLQGRCQGNQSIQLRSGALVSFLLALNPTLATSGTHGNRNGATSHARSGTATLLTKTRPAIATQVNSQRLEQLAKDAVRLEIDMDKIKIPSRDESSSIQRSLQKIDIEESAEDFGEDPTTTISDVHHVTFLPGPIGIEYLEGDEAVIVKVVEGGQAEQKGVQVGWRISQVGDQTCNSFEDEAILDAIDGSSPYQVKFLDPQVSTHALFFHANVLEECGEQWCDDILNDILALMNATSTSDRKYLNCFTVLLCDEFPPEEVKKQYDVVLSIPAARAVTNGKSLRDVVRHLLVYAASELVSRRRHKYEYNLVEQAMLDRLGWKPVLVQEPDEEDDGSIEIGGEEFRRIDLSALAEDEDDDDSGVFRWTIDGSKADLDDPNVIVGSEGSHSAEYGTQLFADITADARFLVDTLDDGSYRDEMCILLLDDSQMQTFNKVMHLKQFSDSRPLAYTTGGSSFGDLVISVPHAERQAAENDCSLRDQLRYTIGKGVLLLMGYEEDSERMEVAQDYLFSELGWWSFEEESETSSGAQQDGRREEAERISGDAVLESEGEHSAVPGTALFDDILKDAKFLLADTYEHLSVCLCDDDHLLKTSARSGELLISIPAAEREAAVYGHSVRDEVRMLVVQGMLQIFAWPKLALMDAEQMTVEEQKALQDYGYRGQGILARNNNVTATSILAADGSLIASYGAKRLKLYCDGELVGFENAEFDDPGVFMCSYGEHAAKEGTSFYADLLSDAKDLLQAADSADKQLFFVVIDDKNMQTINNLFLGKEYPTDVLSFPPEDDDYDVKMGNIFVCMQVAERQAKERGHSTRDEVRILLVHGILHLLGHDHELGVEEAEEMSIAERELLSDLGWQGRGLIIEQGDLGRSSDDDVDDDREHAALEDTDEGLQHQVLLSIEGDHQIREDTSEYVDLHADALALLRAASPADRLEVSILLCDMDRMREMSEDMDSVFDSRLFTLTANSQSFLGDMAISIPNAEEQATQHDRSLRDELRIMLVKGLLTLLGYAQESSEESEAMRHAERHLVGKLGWNELYVNYEWGWEDTTHEFGEVAEIKDDTRESDEPVEIERTADKIDEVFEIEKPRGASQEALDDQDSDTAPLVKWVEWQDTPDEQDHDSRSLVDWQEKLDELESRESLVVSGLDVDPR